MDNEANLTAFERLSMQLADATDPWPVVDLFEADLMARYPAQATEVIELMTHWLHKLGLVNDENMTGYV